MAAFDKSAGHGEDAVDVDVNVHRAHGEVLVLFLELLGQLVGVANLHVVEEEHVAVVTNPLEHLEKKEEIA